MRDRQDNYNNTNQQENYNNPNQQENYNNSNQQENYNNPNQQENYNNSNQQDNYNNSNQQENYNNSRGSFGIRRIIVVLFGIIELILAFRFILKLLGASENNGFVQGIYGITQPVVGLFEGIFSTMNINIAGIQGVFEPATVIAVVIIGFIEWALLKLISRRTVNNDTRVA